MLSAVFDIYSCTADCTGSLLQWKMSPVDNGCNELQVSMLSGKHCFHLPMLQEYEIVQILRQRRRTDSTGFEIHLVDHFNCFRVLLTKEEFLDQGLKVKPGKNGQIENMNTWCNILTNSFCIEMLELLTDTFPSGSVCSYDQALLL